jgi:penicillin-binding protein 1A
MKKPIPRHWPFLAKVKRHWSHVKPGRNANVRVYSNLSSRDRKARKRAEYLATLPKNPFKRFLYRLRPKQLAKYWFSRQGAIMALKLIGIGFMALIVIVIGLFAYYRKDLDQINPSQLANLVNSAPTRYYDRTGKVLLWQDNTVENKEVVQSNQISPYMKDATVALEDHNFYKEGPISITGIARAALSRALGGTGGGSTLTQQLVKNVFLTDQETISRKIKEAIISFQVDRLYSKDQILTMYLNEVSYGGDRNGVESAAEAYFGTSAKNLTLDEAALLASIPQQPTAFNPQNNPYFDSQGLVDRQHTALQDMAKYGYITEAQAQAAEKINTLAKILPTTTQVQNIIAPAFVFEVQHQLEEQYGTKLVTSGGLKVTTTLDTNLQKIADNLMAKDIQYAVKYGGNNMALVAVQNSTGQILAYEGSRGYNYPGYGSFNAATAPLDPGSSVKIFDYGQLFKQRSGVNYAPGSVLSDEPIDIDGYQPKDFDDEWQGNISIRYALDESRNIPAVKAAYIAGMQNVVNLAHAMGDLAYCDSYCGLSAAIGAYPLQLDQHTNAYATLARGGVYKPLTYILEVQAADGSIMQQWKNTKGTQVLDPQIAYMLSDVLSDEAARVRTFGEPVYSDNAPSGQVGMNPPGIKIAVKTGTTDNNQAGWEMGYSTVMSLGVWVGNANGSPMMMGSAEDPATHLQTGPLFGDFWQQTEPYMYAYGWTGANDWFTEPAGIHKATPTQPVEGQYDLVPSWWGDSSAASNATTVTMDEVSKRKATNCTPPLARQTITYYTSTDPITGQQVISGVPAGYDINDSDNVHQCSDTLPTVSAPTVDTTAGTITVNVTQGTFPLQTLAVQVNGQTVSTQSISAGGQYVINYNFSGTSSPATVVATVTDTGLYQATQQSTANVITTGGNTPGSGNSQ